jgi:hypothetical protein
MVAQGTNVAYVGPSNSRPPVVSSGGCCC